jgi:predicted DNA-binding transcriptional regulator AlpA
MLLSQRQAADFLCLSQRTLERWRVTGTGPAYAKLGRRVAYRQADIEAWITAHVRSSTSEPQQQEPNNEHPRYWHRGR